MCKNWKSNINAYCLISITENWI